jgi:CheY-like chemotaxis protein
VINRDEANSFAWKPPVKEGAAKVVLLVEDEPATLRFYLTGLKGLQGWRMVGAENGERALETLRHEPVDVLVTDLNMPVMDGYRLITAVHDLYPSIPIIVLTSLPPGASQDRAISLGALRVMSKPVRLSLLMEEIKLLGNKEAQGFVRGISLSGLLQLMSWEGKTCTLTVKSHDSIGHLYFRGGLLIHALCGDSEGIVAAYQILTWPQPQVEFVDTCRVSETINMPTEEFLMNLAVIQDTQKIKLQPNDPWGKELK